jgi:hypothetical protein
MGIVNDVHGAPLPDTPPSDGFTPSIPAARFTGGDAIGQADARIRYGVRQLGEHLEFVKANEHRFTAEGRQAAVAAFSDTDAGGDIDAALADAEAYRDEARAAVESERAKLVTADDTASQIRAQRDWERSRTTVEAQQNVGQQIATARKLLADAQTPQAVATLAEEVAPYLASKGLPTDWIDAELAKAAPGYGAAKAEAVQRERQEMKVRHNARVAKQAAADGRLPDPRILVDPT